MRKKILAMITVLALVSSAPIIIPMETVKAAEEENVVDGSILLDGVEEAEGEMLSITKGQYLQTGNSKIVKSGTGKITVGGTTIAQKTVQSVKIAVMVERLVGGSWLSYTSWTTSKENTYYVSTSKTMTVPRGYYYRVRAVHSANSDISNSNTNALYVN